MALTHIRGSCLCCYEGKEGDKLKIKKISLYMKTKEELPVVKRKVNFCPVKLLTTHRKEAEKQC